MLASRNEFTLKREAKNLISTQRSDEAKKEVAMSSSSMGLGSGMMKTVASKALVIKINLAFLSLFFLAYILLLLLQPSSVYEQNATAEIVRCSLRDCHVKKVR